MCYDQEAQAEKERSFHTYGKNNKELNALIEKIPKICQEQEREEDSKRAPTFS